MAEMKEGGRLIKSDGWIDRSKDLPFSPSPLFVQVGRGRRDEWRACGNSRVKISEQARSGPEVWDARNGSVPVSRMVRDFSRDKAGKSVR